MSSRSDTPRTSIHKHELIHRHESSEFIDAHYEVIKQLGQGSFGVVELIHDHRSGFEKVCKTVDTSNLSAHDLELMRKEVEALQELDHPHIVKLYDYVEDAGTLKLILENLSGGDCEGLLQKSTWSWDGLPSEKLVAHLMGQLLGAVGYCHSKGIVHRDIKPENIMLISSCCCWYPFVLQDCKLIDFGLSGYFQGGKQLHEVVGTPAYLAPEIVEACLGSSKGYSGEKVDSWSIGVTTFQLLIGELPFGEPTDYDGDMQPVLENITAFSFLEYDPDLWQSRSPDAFGFVQLLMTRDPIHRPGAIEAMQDHWIEQQRSQHCTSLSRKLISSLQGYANAPMIEKVCLLVIAARLDDAHLSSIRHVFDSLDQRGTGTLHVEDFQEAIDAALHCFDIRVDTSEIFEAEDLNVDGDIEYSEFAAGCLYADLHSKGGRGLAMHAFDALDKDGDGVVTREEVQMMFNSQNPKHHEIINSLPQTAFDQYEFYHFLNAESQQKDDTSIFIPQKPQGMTQRSSSGRSVMDMILGAFCCTTSLADSSNKEIILDIRPNEVGLL
jgi:calcium-dependent protein kinase